VLSLPLHTSFNTMYYNVKKVTTVGKVSIKQAGSMLANSVRSSIRFKLLLIFVLVITILVSFFGLLSYKMSARAVERDFIKYKTSIVEQVSRNMDENIDSLTRQSMAIYPNLGDMLNVLNIPTNKIDITYMDYYNRVDGFFKSVLQSNERLDSVALITLNGEIKYYANKRGGSINLHTVEKDDWFKSAIDLKGYPLLREPHYNEFIDPNAINKRPVISISRSILDITTSQNTPSGILLIEQDITRIQQIFENTKIEAGETVLVLGQTGELINSNHALSEEKLRIINKQVSSVNVNSLNLRLDGEQFLISYYISPKYHWKVVSLLPYSELQKKSLFLKNITISLLIVLLIASFLISAVFTNLITTPLKKLMHSFRAFQRGDFTTRIEINRDDELGQIGSTFNTMVTEIKNLIEQKYELTILRNESELKALQNQINPHFLYNTLTSIQSVIDKGDNENASQMVQHLSDMFRYNLSKGDFLVPFAKELEYIRGYLFIQELRYKERFSVHYDIDERVLEVPILRLTLQPLIENSLFHGLETKREHGELWITAQVFDETCYIYIYDNGLGISEERLTAIQAALDSGGGPLTDDSITNGIGISNVNMRMKYFFGEEYGIKISSVEGSHTTVKITLPLHPKR
jgi:two-component system sensor histidine kinase YesM